MHKIILTDPDTGQQHTGHLPTGWHEVPLSSFLAFHQLHAGHHEGLALQHAVIVLSGLPRLMFDEDVSLAAGLAPYLGFYFQGLPAGEPAPTIEHLGVRYTYTGDVSKWTAGQFEALLAFRDQAAPHPVHAAPQLLAVLYQTDGAEQTAETVAAAAAAFQSLPVSVAWPAVRAFLTAWAPLAAPTQACSVAETELQTALTKMEQALTSARATPSRTLSSRIAGALASRYVRYVRGRLTSSSKTWPGK